MAHRPLARVGRAHEHRGVDVALPARVPPRRPLGGGRGRRRRVVHESQVEGAIAPAMGSSTASTEASSARVRCSCSTPRTASPGSANAFAPSATRARAPRAALRFQAFTSCPSFEQVADEARAQQAGAEIRDLQRASYAPRLPRSFSRAIICSMASSVSSSFPSSRSRDHSRRSSRERRVGQRPEPALDPEVDELALLLDRQLAGEEEARGVLGVDERLEDGPAVAGPLGAEGGERAARRLADQLLLARRQALVLLRLVPAVGVLGDVAQVEHREEAGRRDELLANPDVDPERRRGAQAAPRGRLGAASGRRRARPTPGRSTAARSR